MSRSPGPNPKRKLETPSPSRLSTEVTAEQFESGTAPDQPVLTQPTPKSMTRDMPAFSPTKASTTTPHQASIGVAGRAALGSARQRSTKAVQSLSSFQTDSRASARLKTCDLSKISMICTVAHRGMEIFFASVPTKRTVLGVCSRTRVVLQTLALPSNDKKVTIVSLLSNPQTGMVSVAMSDGMVQTYRPFATTAGPSADPSALVRPYGKFRWIPGPLISCREVFYHDGDDRLDLFSPSSFDISSSGDSKLLVSHRDQLAVFDVSQDGPPADAELLWTTRMDAPVSSAKLSGDGRAIVLVVEGEGIGNRNRFGTRTFLRDSEDGSRLAEAAPIPTPAEVQRQTSSGSAVGIVYKPGPFLIHPTPVSRISFRGTGNITSNVKPDEDEGNDLLLTYCEEDSSARIFSQNSWKQLMHWNTPPSSRADWVRGISAFNLGDLEARRKQGSGSSPNSRHSSMGSIEESADINAGLPGARGMPSVPPSASPTSAAGAWIAELTFRNSFPALRLSRLSYMKRGADESHPAHFESVAAILPTSSLEAESVLEAGDLGLSVEGIWPAWLPWSSGDAAGETEGAPGGSAMALLGLSSGALPSQGMFGESHQSGTHGPPSELRVVASHPHTGKVVVMEFPLWGDLDFGAMELGNPLRYLLALSEASDVQREQGAEESARDAPVVSVEYESDMLCAQIQRRGTSVALTWRRHAVTSVVPASPTVFHAAMSVSESIHSSESYDIPDVNTCGNGPEMFQDLSVVPVPISLPSLRLPRNLVSHGREKLVSVHWWKDRRIGGSPYLFAVTSSGAIVIYELSPPRSALEPSMPNFDPFQMSRTSSAISFDTGDVASDESGEDGVRQDYEVNITPHPDFGIGLRLEAQHDGKPAIAGSFKKHPLNGGILPAERTGMIVLGDEVLSVNGVGLEGIPFDEIIATVRKVGSETKKGEPLCLQFRASLESRLHMAKTAVLSESQRSEGSNRRTMEQILGVAPRRHSSTGGSDIVKVDSDDADSHVSMLVGAHSEMQQELSRVLAVIQKAVPISEPATLLTILPPQEGDDSNAGRSKTAVLVIGNGTSLSVRQIDFMADGQPDSASCSEAGSLDLGTGTGTTSVKSPLDDQMGIVSMDVADDPGCACLLIGHLCGTTSLVLMDWGDPKLQSRSTHTGLTVKLRHFPVVEHGPSLDMSSCVVRASSMELIGFMPGNMQLSHSVSLWAARPSPFAPTQEITSDHVMEANHPEYVMTEISVESFCRQEGEELVDFRFVRTGTLDAFPLVVTMTQTTAIVHRRAGDSFEWTPVVALRYPECDNPSTWRDQVLRDRTSPCVSFPHLIPAVLSLVSAIDEYCHLKSDWHPEAVLAFACTEAHGVGTAMQGNLKGIYSWLARWMDPDDNARPDGNEKFPIGVTPLGLIGGDTLFMEGDDLKEKARNGLAESSAGFMLRSPTQEQSELVRKGDELRRELQRALCPSQRGTSEGEGPDNSRLLLPPPLSRLNNNELRLLWAIGEMLAAPPKFGSLDAEAQLTLFCLRLVQILMTAKDDDENDESNHPSTTSSTDDMIQSSFRVHSKPVLQPEDAPRVSLMASAGCVSAIASSSQGRLLRSYRATRTNEKFDWNSARQFRIPLWLRSTEQLQKISEEIGQSVYRQTRDIMESALFFIIVRNSRTMRNLAATDASDSGRKFLKFISAYDFASERGRKAAEKNAYSLLRKRKYRAAASFFLLPEPPMLKTALEVMVTQMQDFELAFMTARLLENATKTVGGLSTFGSVGVGGMMGGGAGFASADEGVSTEVADDRVTFDKWKPDIGQGAQDLIRSRGIPEASTDPCLRALLFIWLGQTERGARCLSGLASSDQSDAIVPLGFRRTQTTPVPSSIEIRGPHHDFRKPTGHEKSITANNQVISMASAVINFAACPFLVTSLEASARTRWAATLFVSRALSRRGLDLQAARSILQNTDKANTNKVELVKRNQKPQSQGSPAGRVEAASSIFDAFNVPQQKKQTTTTENAPPSIFDSFDVPQRPRKPSAVPTAPESSIFADFDARPAQNKSHGSGSVASSSIFDSFATAPQTLKPTLATKSNGEASSSIFDSFDIAPPKSNLAVPKHSESDPTRTSASATQETTDQSMVTEKVDSDAEELSIPELWKEWRKRILVWSVARRLIRELARVVSRFRGDAIDAPISIFRKHTHPLLPSNVGEILHDHCDGDDVLTDAKSCINEICTSCKVDKNVVTSAALRILSADLSPKRIVFAALLCSATNRDTDAEMIVRQAAAAQTERCETFSIANDELVDNRRTSHCVASQHLRRTAARVSWQLELCLWLHRGGALTLSPVAIKESTVAVRIGLMISSWGRSPECLESMLRCEPDCPMDDQAGRQLWSSMKLISGVEEKTKRVERVSSGGWEFLVECRRDDATEMLRTRPCGTFLIRPHSERTGVFTLSFKTNLVPTDSTATEKKDEDGSDGLEEKTEDESDASKPTPSKPVRKDDVVQHAIIRLSDVGFRCGSFGPFTSLMNLLEAVSSSLPFDLLFNAPPTQALIKDEGSQPSPNAVYLRKFALTAHSERFRWNGEGRDLGSTQHSNNTGSKTEPVADSSQNADTELARRRRFGMFLQLVVLSEIRKQLCSVVAAELKEVTSQDQQRPLGEEYTMDVSQSRATESYSEGTESGGAEQAYAVASRLLRPLLNWCRALETRITSELAPDILELLHSAADEPLFDVSSRIEKGMLANDKSNGGDAVIRRMIQRDSGVEFRTVRVGEAGESAMIVLFSKTEATNWLVKKGLEKSEEDAMGRLEWMERRRVIEPIESKDMAVKPIGGNGFDADQEKVRYRFVDPWEVEVLANRDAETTGASLGREHFYEFSITSVARSCEDVFRAIGGVHLLGLWAYAKGGLRLTKAIASVHAPWERDAGGDLQMSEGTVTEPPPFSNSIRQHLYRNALFRRLKTPQRFLALVQVELLDLKNLTSPGGSPSLSVYALLRLKRPGSSAPLTHKARTLDSAATQPKKIGKSSGPNAPASWGSVVRFRFPLPEDVNCDGVSVDGNREALFRGPPSVLQISVYEKKFMSDLELGDADIKLDGLTHGGQMEEWVPLRSLKQGHSGTGGISWFARIRLTLRFELMCLESDSMDLGDRPHSVGLRRIQELSKLGGAYEDAVKRSSSTTDLFSYIESNFF